MEAILGVAVRGSKAVAGGVLAAVVLVGCAPIDDLGVAGSGDRSRQAADRPAGTNPLDNPEGVERGLAPIASGEDRGEARELIDKVRTKGRGPRTGYDRDEFGYAWADTAKGVPLAGNGCDTRNDLLARDGREVEYREGSDCVVVAMVLDDPYTGRTIEWRKADAAEVQIDHIVPLSYGWQMGAARWPEARRVQFANDPLNLLPVDGSTNSSKSDSSPASWLPPQRRIRCAYVVRFAQVVLEYDLPVTSADKASMLAQCS